MNKGREKEKHKLENLINDMINNGSEEVTTLSEDPEAKYESIDEKEPGRKNS